MRILIIGTGYVGLVTGLCLAEMGNKVYCLDNNIEKINSLNKGSCPFYEEGIDKLLERNLSQGRLIFTIEMKEALQNTDICFIAVGTPSDNQGNADLKHVFAAAADIGKYMFHHMYIVDKSTVPVGTGGKVRRTIQDNLNERKSNLTFDVISNPEFLKEGSAVQDCLRPDRIILGCDNENSVQVMKELYRPFVRSTENFIIMDIKSAEMTKYAANSMLATKISFMNEMANICERVGADINKVRMGIGSDNRIGYSFIYAGCGYGGSCFPKDIRGLINTGMENGYEANILKAVEKVNTNQKQILSRNVTRRFGQNLTGYTFAVWGLSFKPDTDDMREASSIEVINDLTNRGARIKAYDPKATSEARNIYLKGNEAIEYMENKYDALTGSDAMILITEWKEFRSPDFMEMKKRLNSPVIFDGRNQYSSDTLEQLEFEYYQIGVPLASGDKKR